MDRYSPRRRAVGHDACVSGYAIFVVIGACVVGVATYGLFTRYPPKPVGAPTPRLSRAEVLALTPSMIIARRGREGIATNWARTTAKGALEVVVGNMNPGGPDDDRMTAVVARTSDRDVVVTRTGTLRSAERNSGDLRRELEQIGAAAFCARHGLARGDVSPASS